MNIIHTIIKKALLAIKRVNRVIVDALRPSYANWMPPKAKEKDVNEDANNTLANSPKPKQNLEEKYSSGPVGNVDKIELDAKNKEIAALQAKIAEYQKEIGETEPFKKAIIKIKEALAAEEFVKQVGRVGRPSKNRAKRTVKIDTVLLIVYGFARENGILYEDFSSVLNSALHLYFKEHYPAAYAIYEQAIDENNST